MKRLPRQVKKSARPFLEKFFNSLELSVEIFNRPSETGRTDTVLMLFDHATEMLMKASLLQKGAQIRDRRTPYSIGFQACINRACSDAQCQFLEHDEARIFTSVNALRDAVQHFYLKISEEQLYFHIQSGLTLMRDVLERVFSLDLIDFLPRRVLPLSTVALTTIEVLYDQKIEEVRNLLRPGGRKRQEAIAALRPLLILERSIRGLPDGPSDAEIAKTIAELRKGGSWATSFPGISLVEFESGGEGASISLRFAKKEGVPVTIVAPDFSGASAIGIKRVNELDFYNLTTTQIAARLGLTVPRFVALVEHLGLQDSEDHFKLIELGKQQHKRYSQKALIRAREELAILNDGDLAAIWDAYSARRRFRKKAA